MLVLAHHVLLGLAVLALLAAGGVASALGAAGLERVIAAVVLAAAAAAAQALALGLVSLGGSPFALFLAAAATWLAAHTLLPRAETAPLAELGEWWGGLGRGARAAAGVIAGLVIVELAWVVRWPGLTFDGIVYHLPEVVAWVQNGRPGSIVNVLYELPVGNYPVTNEVLLAWATGIARSLVPVALWSPLALVLLGVAGWSGLRSLRVPVLPRALAVATLATTPILLEQLEGPGTDVPAVAWLACAGAFVATRRPTLLAPAIVAAALAIGTKTTTAPLALLVVAVGAWDAWKKRDADGRPLAAPIVAALVLGAIAGGAWYIRNLLDHGSPLWPFVSGPFGDPVPPIIDALGHSLLERPRATLDRRLGFYADALAGALIVLAAGVLAAVARPRRPQIAASAVALGAILLWAAAPITGVGDIAELAELAGSAIRYLLPALGAATVALAFVATARRTHTSELVVAGLFAAATVWNLVRLAGLPFPDVPRPVWLVAGVVVGGLIGALLPRRAALPQSLRRVAAPVLAILAGAVVALGATGFVERHGEADVTWDAPVVRWLAPQATYRDSERPVAAAPTTSGALAGDEVDHPLPVIPLDESCDAIRERASRGWVMIRIVGRVRLPSGADFPALGNAAQCLAAERPAFRTRVLRVYRLRPGEVASGLEASIRRRARAPLPGLTCDEVSCRLGGAAFPVTVDTFTTCWRLGAAAPPPVRGLTGCVLGG